MRRLVAVLAFALVGCGGSDGGQADVGMDQGAPAVDADVCSALPPHPETSQPCVYAAPDDVACSSIRSIRVDGVPMDPSTYSVQCYSDGRSLIWLHPGTPDRCEGWSVTACAE
jgi:hypothetical protein